jgi:hypothetical protein
MIELPDYRYLNESEKHAISTKCKMLHLAYKGYDYGKEACYRCKFVNTSCDHAYCELNEYHKLEKPDKCGNTTKEYWPFDDEWTGNRFVTDGKKVFSIEIPSCGDRTYGDDDKSWLDWLYEEERDG